MIKISTKVRYGLRALVDLAAQNAPGPVFLKSIADRQKISRNYLDALFCALRCAGIVRSVRGASGGYFLNGDPGQIRVLDVVKALEGRPVVVECIDRKAVCDRASECSTRDVWVQMRDAIEASLAEVSLKDLVKRGGEKKGPLCLMYYI